MELSQLSLPNSGSLTAYIADPAIGYHVWRKRPGIILAPGGSYLFLATREGEGVALEFLARGYNVFLLEYSVGFLNREMKESGLAPACIRPYPAPVLEMMEAIHLIRANPEPWNLDSDRLYLMGFSAGAHVCAMVGTSWDRTEFTKQLSFVAGDEELKPAGMVLSYPLLNPTPDGRFNISDTSNPDCRMMREFLFGTEDPSGEQKDELNVLERVSDKTAPAFVWHAYDDQTVPCEDSTRFVLKMQEKGIPCEYHLFDHGGHGIALANRTYARTPRENDPGIARWVQMADEWMQRNPETNEN